MLTRYYSGNGIDKYVEQFLPATGFACDVGANDGTFFSNTLHFEDKGWTVLCIEPNPLNIKSGHETRKLWRQVACGARDETGILYTRGGDNWASGTSLTTDDVVHNTPHAFEFPVTVLRLDRVLEEAGFHKLDYLSVDTELSEPAVMAGFTVERWKPTIIVLENIEDRERIQIPRYEVIHRMEFDNVYKRKD